MTNIKINNHIEVFTSFDQEYINEISKKSQKTFDKWKNCSLTDCCLSYKRLCKGVEVPSQCLLCKQKDYFIRYASS